MPSLPKKTRLSLETKPWCCSPGTSARKPKSVTAAYFYNSTLQEALCFSPSTTGEAKRSGEWLLQSSHCFVPRQLHTGMADYKTQFALRCPAYPCNTVTSTLTDTLSSLSATHCCKYLYFMMMLCDVWAKTQKWSEAEEVRLNTQFVADALIFLFKLFTSEPAAWNAE